MPLKNVRRADVERASPQPFVGEIVVPILVAAIPAGLFLLLGVLTAGLDNPRAEPSPLVVLSMLVIEALGMGAMAFVFLMRKEIVFGKLLRITSGRPRAWRRVCLGLSMICLLLFDLLTNLSAAFAGAQFLALVSLPLFLAYVGCHRVAFAGLDEYHT